MDIGAAVSSTQGVTADKLAALPDWRGSTLFDARERLALELADALTSTPATVPDEQWRRLAAAFSRPELVELVAGISWENYRARFNRAFDVVAEGFSEGAACALPTRSPAGAPPGTRDHDPPAHTPRG